MNVQHETPDAQHSRGRGSSRRIYAIPRNEPILFPGHFLCITRIERNLCGLQRAFANGFVSENEPILGGLEGVGCREHNIAASRRTRLRQSQLRYADAALGLGGEMDSASGNRRRLQSITRRLRVAGCRLCGLRQRGWFAGNHAPAAQSRQY